RRVLTTRAIRLRAQPAPARTCSLTAHSPGSYAIQFVSFASFALRELDWHAHRLRGSPVFGEADGGERETARPGPKGRAAENAAATYGPWARWWQRGARWV